MSLATRTTVERALGALIMTIDLDGVTLASFPAIFRGDESEEVPLGVHCICGEIGQNGEIPEDWSKLVLPAIVVASARSEPHLVGYDICDVSIIAITTPDEIDAPAKVQARIGWLSAFFDEDNLDAIAEMLNVPATGPDVRKVRGLQVIGIERAGEDHTENGRQVLSTLKLRVHAVGVPVDSGAEASPDTFLL